MISKVMQNNGTVHVCHLQPARTNNSQAFEFKFYQLFYEKKK